MATSPRPSTVNIDHVRARAALHALGPQGDGLPSVAGLAVALRTQGLIAGLVANGDGRTLDVFARYLLDRWPARPARGPAGGSAEFGDLVRTYVRMSVAESAAVEAEAIRFAEVLYTLEKALKVGR